MIDLTDKTAIVTGAASGIGEESAKRLADDGATVVVADVDESGGNQTVDEIKANGAEASFVRADVSDPDSVQRLVDVTLERYGSLDIAHNNAGITNDITQIDELTESQWDTVLDINLKGVWTCLKAELPAMMETGGGAIVNTASETALGGAPGIANYVASKHGVVGLTKSAALEYAADGIRVNAICPGPIETDITDLEDDGLDAQVRENTPMKRMGEPEEVAAAVSWLCSSESSFVTGHPLVIDGGRLAG